MMIHSHSSQFLASPTNAKPKSIKLLLSASLCLFVLSGCGGGGGGSENGPEATANKTDWDAIQWDQDQWQ